MNANKYSEIISNAVANCSREMMDMMKARGLKMVDFVEHDVYLPTTVFEQEGDGSYIFDTIESISLTDENEIIVKGERGIGYLDCFYGDFFKVADSIGSIYRALVESFERVDEGKSRFVKEEFEEKYSYGVTKDMWSAIIFLLDLGENDVNNIVSMKLTESDDKFDYIYIDFNDKYNGANYCVIRDKKNDDIYLPIESNGAYPATIKDISMYSWANIEGEKIMLNSENEMEKYDATTRRRLEYLNKNFPTIFDGISFRWHKNHTMCVQSTYDRYNENGDKNISYVAIYNKPTDIIPLKLSKMEKLDVSFPPLF